MKPSFYSPFLPGYLIVLVALYFVASLAHFSHNAEYLALYPGLPQRLTREAVYIAWLGVTSVGALAVVLYALNLYSSAWLALAVYGAFGLDGVAHYTLAPVSEHTLVANVTIWAEASTGLLILLASTVFFVRRIFVRKLST